MQATCPVHKIFMGKKGCERCNYRFMVSYWIDRKCIEKGCWNVREGGVVYCIRHLHGFPQRLPDDAIAALKKSGVE